MHLMDFTVRTFALFLEAIVQQRHRRGVVPNHSIVNGPQDACRIPEGNPPPEAQALRRKGAAGNAAATLENPVAGCQGMALAPGLSRPHPALAESLERVTQRLDPLLLAAEQGPVDRRVQLHGVAQRPEGAEQHCVGPAVAGIACGGEYVVLGRVPVFRVAGGGSWPAVRGRLRVRFGRVWFRLGIAGRIPVFRGCGWLARQTGRVRIRFVRNFDRRQHRPGWRGFR